MLHIKGIFIKRAITWLPLIGTDKKLIPWFFSDHPGQSTKASKYEALEINSFVGNFLNNIIFTNKETFKIEFRISWLDTKFLEIFLTCFPDFSKTVAMMNNKQLILCINPHNLFFFHCLQWCWWPKCSLPSNPDGLAILESYIQYNPPTWIMGCLVEVTCVKKLCTGLITPLLA